MTIEIHNINQIFRDIILIWFLASVAGIAIVAAFNYIVHRKPKTKYKLPMTQEQLDDLYAGD